MKHILLPTDFSENSWEAIQYAMNLFKKQRVTFFLMHSYEPHVSAPSTAVTSKRANSIIMDSIKEEAKNGLQETLKKALEVNTNKEHQFKTIIINDYFLGAVQSTVSNMKIDAVVVGTKGASGLKEVTIGSNTANLIGKLKCPIIAVPKNVVLKSLSDIGFASDYSISEYHHGLDLLIELASNFKSKISVVHVMNHSKELSSEMRANKMILEAELKPIPIDFYCITDVSVEVGTRIFSESRQLDMMCVIAKQHGFFDKLLHKSQSKSISHHAKVPLIIFNHAAFA
ncbi:universal stress protein [Mangrovimonas sp. CR14]|uniref:universal stress protein n=1 Tax=Mangrovimonas sp. CR14 TaxID=2706120 RepID=UPI00141F5649|nr:universal stress protein [Mangrovimonas sp. CR14]NIK91820.1 universal stress protein [Mangrovimonas sp. CR14]